MVLCNLAPAYFPPPFYGSCSQESIAPATMAASPHLP